MQHLAQLGDRILAGEAVIAGVSSGTSADGIDVALLRTLPALTGLAECVAFRTVAFSDELRGRVRTALDGAAEPGFRATALLSRDLGRAFGAALRDVAREAGVTVDLAGSHGQTVWHHDGSEASGPATLQLGDGDFVAEEAGCPVVSDFRQRDIAAGGEGAPLIALVDDLLFPHLPEPAAVLNLGGIANLTCLPGRSSFDTGPAGCLLDGLARRILGHDFDEGGRVAGSARPRAEFVEQLLEHPFYRKEPPKSTGRDTFGEPWVDEVVRRAAALEPPLEGPELLATAVELVARAVGAALDAFGPPDLRALVVAGGGVHHRGLMAALERIVGPRCAGAVPGSAAPIVASSVHGIDPDGREALGFGLLAACFAVGRPVTLPNATGARRGRLLGKFSP